MALVLTGSFTAVVTVVDENGVEKRVTLRRGQSVDPLNLSEKELATLRSQVGYANGRTVPLFTELPGELNYSGTHMTGGKISTEAVKAQKAADVASVEPVAADEVEKVEEPVAAAEVEKVEEPVVVVPAEAVAMELKQDGPAPSGKSKSKSSPSKKNTASKKKSKK